MGNLFDRIKNVIKKLTPYLPFYKKEPLPEEETTDVEELQKQVDRADYLDDAKMVHLIRKAARNVILVKLLYANVWRLVEPYSFRQGTYGLLFYGHDMTRNGTRSYYIHRIQQLELTNIPFNPRWVIEL